jgi:hypothetical protein
VKAPRVLPAFLSARERVVVANLARAADKSGAFEPGRGGTGYDKASLLESLAAERLVKRCLKALGDPVLFDAWLIRYPVGSEIAAHTDPPIEGLCHVRLNALALAGRGGLLYVDGAEVLLDTGDAVLFRPDLMRHLVTRVEGNERLMLSVGANVEEAAAARLFAS